MDLVHERLFSTGTLIKALREEQGISMSEFARRCNTQRQYVYKAERDILKTINYDMIEMFAKALNVNPAYLVGWSDIRERVPEMGLVEDISENTDVRIKRHIDETRSMSYKTPEADTNNYTTMDITGEE